jgi:hypothetical protein
MRMAYFQPGFLGLLACEPRSVNLKACEPMNLGILLVQNSIWTYNHGTRFLKCDQ